MARRFLTAIGARQWDSAAAAVGEAEAQRFRDERLAFLAAVAEHEREIVRAMSENGSGGMASAGGPLTLDTAVLARHRAWPVRALDGEPKLGELAALPPRRFYARMYEAPLNCWYLPSANGLRIVGTVLDADSVAYVVYQSSTDHGDAEPGEPTTAVLTLTRSAGGWGVRPGQLGPQVDFAALLDTSVAGRAMMAEACADKKRRAHPPGVSRGQSR